MVVNEKNVGAYATQNRALDLANGEYVAILNSDDVWRAGKLEAQVSVFEKNTKAGLCYTLGTQIDEGEGDGRGSAPPLAQEGSSRIFFHTCSPRIRLLASGVMFRRGAIRFEESLRFSGDWVAWLQLVENSQVACVPEPLVGWRQHSTNSYRRSETVTLEEIRVRRAILASKKRWLDARADKSVIRKGLSECAVDG